MRVFLLRIVAAKNSRRRGVVTGISNDDRHGERIGVNASTTRRQVLVLATHAGTIGVNLDPHHRPRAFPLIV
jgi:hypothetical protein